MSRISRRQVLRYGATLALPTVATTWPLSALAAQRPDPYADAKLVTGEPPLPTADSFTIAVLPDTQKYSESYPEQFHAQTNWLAEQARRRNIACVLHLGDITNRSTPAEWEVADKALTRLDGNIPYFLVPGNHDYSEGGTCVDRTTRLNEYFPVARFADRPEFGGVYDREPQRMENSFHTFAAGGRKFLVLGLEFGPRRDVVRWANEVADRHADHEAILITHAYMYYDDTRYDWQRYGAQQRWNPHGYKVAAATNDDVFDGEQLWTELVSKHENFICTLNGHVLDDGLGRIVTPTPAGRNVAQMLVNFQMKPNGGDGWLRLMEFKPDGKTVDICDYSPTLGQRNESPQNRFSLTLSPPAKA